MKYVLMKRLTGLAEKIEELGKTSSVIKRVAITPVHSHWS